MSKPAPFQPLGKFEWPSTTVNRGVDLALSQLLKSLRRSNKDAGIDPNLLSPAPRDLLDRICEPPAHFPLLAEMDATLSAWTADESASDRVQTIILPPCDREDLLGQWAKTHTLQTFGTDRKMAELDALDDPHATPLVIPKLERRFLRTRSGLHDIRQLLDRLSVMERRIIIGCNSWAWQFLRKSCEIDLIFDAPMTFQAFDKNRLRVWLGTLALDPADGANLCFRSASSGQDVFSNGEGEADVSEFISDLAKASIGVPWVAWHLWKDSLHVANAIEADEMSVEPIISEADPRETIWVTDIRPPSVPSRSDQNALLVLHALLIHGGLTGDQIVQTVPLVTYTHVLASLVRSGLIDKVDGLYRCRPAAYPVIRDGLNNSGYPVDVL
ncbi:hypothetical protein GCM10009069_10980 [Algimonas arctica]|uniref:Uncharacterized protein n=1 Tax=Algimonas arctica TaxID=1479486 RepID=A0A8J3CRC9_9PROT|nr:hypothetical protein [Algimonas arctica]GHA89629.1 hypothetical protein GCM10009069_10980 [Algimonas arctica]